MTLSSPLISIVTPTYNRAAYIAKTIDSVLKQDERRFELIIVDDGSTDETETIVLSFADDRIKYFKKKNGERATARNYGVQKSQGGYVTFLDSDDILKPNHLSVAYDFLTRRPEAEIFHLGYDVILPDDTIIHPWKVLPDPVNDKLLEGNFLSCLGVFLKREILIQYPFNEDRQLSGSEDYELWMRLAARYTINTIAYSTACLVNHDSRSVLNFKTEVLVTRIELLKTYVLGDEAVNNKFGLKLNLFTGYLDLYLALHLAMQSEQRDAMKVLRKALVQAPVIFFNYRFWVVIKKIILG